MSVLEKYGWNPHFGHHYQSNQLHNTEAGRIITIEGFKHIVQCASGLYNALVAGALLNVSETYELPKTGDWVIVKTYDDQAVILRVLPRQNELSRKLPGRSTEKQVIAANIDFAFLVQGLDRDFNLMRLQRYLQQVVTCGIKPIVILNKKDLVPDPNSYRDQVMALGYGCPLVLTSAQDPADVSQSLAEYLQPAKTYILLGSSGAGKSTLLNALLGYRFMDEGPLGSNQKGQHTTTTRHLVLLPQGSMVIDSPGMREFGITLGDDQDTAIYHPDIEELAEKCRFRDCSHEHEPGCAVIEAVESGILQAQVYNSFRKLKREQYHYRSNAQAKKRVEKQFGRIVRQVNKHRKNYKF